MRIRRFVTLLSMALTLSVSGGVVQAQEATSSTTALSESDALKMAQEWATLVSQANVEGLRKLLSDNYVHIHASALVESKDQFLEALKTGSRKYDPINLEEIHVRVFGSSAVVTGKFNLKVLARGKTIEGINRFGLVLAKMQTGQQVVSFQATAIPQLQK